VLQHGRIRSLTHCEKPAKICLRTGAVGVKIFRLTQPTGQDFSN